MGEAVLAVSGRRLSAGERLLRAFGEASAELTQFLVRVLGSVEDAQDAVQEAFLKCWRHRRRVARVRNLRAWIFRVGLNTARDLHRSGWHRRVRALPEHFDPGAREDPSPEDALDRREVLDRLRLALRELRPEERAVFLLRQNSDLTYQQIAARRHAPVGTVKTQMRTALQKVRLLLRGGPGEG